MASNPRSPTQRNSRSGRQAPPSLPNLPRFHPANFVSYANSNTSSSSSSNAVSPEVVIHSPMGPLSPRTARQTSHLSEAQRQLYLYHRELYSINRSGSGPGSPGATPAFGNSRPASPNLQPLASPGAVTPLELEEADQSEGYLMAGARSPRASRTSLNEAAKDEILDTYIRRETQAIRRGDSDIGARQ